MNPDLVLTIDTYTLNGFYLCGNIVDEPDLVMTMKLAYLLSLFTVLLELRFFKAHN